MNFNYIIINWNFFEFYGKKYSKNMEDGRTTFYARGVAMY